MSWTNIKLIFQREVRDQFRDRRTLFMIAVLPLLLYPMFGICIFQIKQFMREQPLKVLLVGEPQLEGLPKLVEDDHFADALFPHDPARATTLKLEIYPADAQNTTPEKLRDMARRAVRQAEYEAVVLFPPDFTEQLQQFRARLIERPGDAAGGDPARDVPSPEIFYNTAHEKSQLAYHRVSGVLERWTEAIGVQNLKDSKLPASAARPFAVNQMDVAGEGHKDAAMWSKILPVVLLIWAMTGAFYPAVDLCAGEKERGTLETLLSSPAERSEIVCGKLMTIMLFSMITSILNLASMGLTALFVVEQMQSLAAPGPVGLPPLSAAIWLLVALVPISALFSAVCLALAALARSTKEGQYYLMPLIMITIPLVVLPMTPAVELTLGNSLIPVTGVVLLLRSMLEGNFWQAAPYILPVTLVTLGCCVLAVRWAVDQFNTESVLFRGAERLDVGLWLRHLVRDREDTPTVGEAILCGVLILSLRFFLSFSQSLPDKFADFAVAQSLYLLAGVAGPALIMAVLLTRRPGATLLLRLPPWRSVPMAVALAAALHPLAMAMSFVVHWLYPLDPSVTASEHALAGLFAGVTVWKVLLVLALVPAVCEELAFRGFILSGLRHMGHKWRAIVISSVFFGVTHLVIQQTLVATVVGVVVGYIAVQSGSLWPCVAFHFTHNALALLAGKLAEWQHGEWLARFSDEGIPIQYHWWVVLLGALAAFGLFQWFRRLPYAHSREESLQEAIDRQAAHVTA